jgi:hypothetical protein
MAASNKDTIYIDIDDEITGVIDKVRGSQGKLVALVLPKRAAVFQSIVNMKLLKRAADDSKKNLVLITTEAGLLPLAGAAGIHVAKTLNSKPEIPSAPDAFDDDKEESIQEDPDEPVDGSKSVGQLAGAAGAGALAADGVETLTLDDEDLPPEATPDTPNGPKSFEPPAGKGKKPKKNKKLAVPNFERFRLWLVLGGLLLLLIIGGLLFATFAQSKATITVKTDATKIDTNLDLNLNTAAKTLDPDNGTIPAKAVSSQKTYSQQVPATGQKNNGNKASGSVGLQNCIDSDDPVTIPAGTGLSSGGNTYITQSSVVLPPSSFSSSDKCKTPRIDVDVIAQSGGSAYNGANSFTVAGYSNVNGMVANTITGGTDNIVQIVNQNDINTAKGKITPNENEIKQNLRNQLKSAGYYPLDATYSAGTPATTSSPNVGDVANNVTVTEAVTYTMFGVKQDDLETLVKNSVKDQIDTSKQSVLDSGLSKAVFNVGTMTPSTAAISMSTSVTAGPDLDADSIKSLAAGKKAGPVRTELENNPDVKSVDIHVSPFWVGTIPKNQDKITVKIAEPEQSKSSSADGNSP